jgi:hypothetical protein
MPAALAGWMGGKRRRPGAKRKRALSYVCEAVRIAGTRGDITLKPKPTSLSNEIRRRASGSPGQTRGQKGLTMTRTTIAIITTVGTSLIMR